VGSGVGGGRVGWRGGGKVGWHGGGSVDRPLGEVRSERY
jgi:hypothetical protein